MLLRDPYTNAVVDVPDPVDAYLAAGYRLLDAEGAPAAPPPVDATLLDDLPDDDGTDDDDIAD